jgi:carotenoid cleavage dioxygenase-like enzyme
MENGQHTEFTTLEQENFKRTLQTTGNFPDWLIGGSYIRNGPAIFEKGSVKLNHWIDGLAMLHKFEFKSNNIVEYTNHALRTDHYKEVYNNKYPYPLFGTDHTYQLNNLTHAILDLATSSHKTYMQNSNVSVGTLSGELVAYGDYGAPIIINPQTLEVQEIFKYNDKIPKLRTLEPGHPLFDSNRNKIYGLVISYDRVSRYIFYELEVGSNIRKITSIIKTETPSYIHSFSMTENYLILVEYPFVLNLKSFLISKSTFTKNFRWAYNMPTVITIISKKDGEVIHKYNCDPIFSFHHVNAFEFEGLINLDLIAYPNSDVIAGQKQFSSKSNNFQFDGMESKFIRYSLSIKEKKQSTHVVFNGTSDMPKINHKYIGFNYEYAYTVDILPPDGTKISSSIYKINTKKCTYIEWSEIDCHPSEAIFIAKPSSLREDDGIIMSIVNNIKTKKSFLIQLDAKNLKEICRSDIPHHIPQGLHGNFFTKL